VVRGTMIRFNADKGYGFVAVDGLDEDVFLHVNDVDVDESELGVGAVIELELDESDRGVRATRASLIEAAPRPGAANAGSSADQLRSELTELLVTGVPSLTGAQVIEVRSAVTALARAHGWLADDDR
jgi:cold shock protein